MSRTKKLRRFDPPMPITRSLLELESSYVAREIDNYLLLSTNELRRSVLERGELLHRAEQTLHGLLKSLPLRHRLSIAAIVDREMLIALELVNTTMHGRLADQLVSSRPGDTGPEEEELPVVMKFSASLFEMEDSR